MADQDVIDQFQNIKDKLEKFQAKMEILPMPDPSLQDRLHKFWQTNEPSILVRWTYAGTLMLPDKKYDQTKIEKANNSLKADFEKGRSAWQKHFQSEKQEWQKDLELSILQLNVAQVCINTVDTVHQKVENTIVPNYENAISDVQTSLNRFQTLDIEKKSQLKEAIVSENHSLLQLWQHERLPVMIETILAANLATDLQNFIHRVDLAFNKLSEEHTIFKRKDLEHGIPRSVVDSISLKVLVQHESLRHLINRHETVITEIQSKQEQLQRNISEIDQIVEFNLEAALNLLQEKKDSQAAEQAKQIVIEGLERTIHQLNDLKTLSFDISQTAGQDLREMTSDFEQEVHDLTESEKIFALKLKHARARTRQQIIAQGQRIWQVIKNILPIIYRYARRIYEAIHSRFARIRKIAGLTPKAVRMEEELTKFLTETRKSVESLPFVYQRLFRLEPLTDERFFTSRKSEMDRLKDGLSNWENGRFAASALVGEKGSGKTTLLNFFQNDHEQDFTILNYTLTETTTIEEDLLDQLKEVLDFKDAKTIEELEAQISESQERKVLICENIHNLFIRTVDGFGTLERFLLFISRTNEKIHWIVTCSLYGWEYLDKVLNISKYFSHVIEMESLSKQDIENIILKRHRVSGYELEFEVTPNIVQSRKFKKLDTKAEQQSYLQDLFFKQLNELASGNVTVALLFWQKAINKVTKDHIEVTPEIQLEHSFLFQMPAEELFTLAALIQHENLDHQQHARIFRQGEQKSELLLERMRNSGIVIKKQKGYVIHLFLFRPIVRALKAKNILH
ncbi:MAG: ATP-binding protein [bacterium]|nr:ATP-binding protein [bacterium]